MGNNNSDTTPQDLVPETYDLNGKIAMTAIIMLLTVIFLIVCLHMYARWVLYRARQRHLRRRQRRTRLVFSSQPTTLSHLFHGLEASVLNSLPTFVYSSNTHDQVLECAVCISEFEDNEKGRLLPKCNHRFHIDCIDMWFHSHNTCPLCRALVQPEILVPVTDIPAETVISVDEMAGTEVGSSSWMCSSCQHQGDEMGCSSSSPSSSSSSALGSRKKPLELAGVSIELPGKRESCYSNLEEELGLGSPRVRGHKTPLNRILSLKRILSIDKISALSRSTSALSFTSATETDLERGGEEAEPLRTQEPHDDS